MTLVEVVVSEDLRRRARNFPRIDVLIIEPYGGSHD